MNSLISEKGQVTIPKKLRKQLGLTPGTVLEFCEQNGKLVGKKKSMYRKTPTSAATPLKSKFLSLMM